MEKVKQYAVVGIFFLFICGFSIAHFLLPDMEISHESREELAQAPTLTWESVRTGKYFTDAESYLLAQFPLRPQFLDVKRTLDKNLFLMDNTGGYVNIGKHQSDMKPTRLLKEEQVEHAVKVFNKIIDSHPEANRFYYTIVPDKNYYISRDYPLPYLDYQKLEQMASDIHGEGISIDHLLTLEDYYYTDSHWRQEQLLPVAEALCQAMGVTPADSSSYSATTLEGFKGSYFYLSGTNPDPEKLLYLQNDAIANAIVKQLNNSLKLEAMSMYIEENVNKEFKDSYDVYLGGPASMITIENPNATSQKHLILIRDSFGSSLAPLLVDSYAKITILDLRYLKSAYWKAVGVDFTNADVLFLCSTTMLNNAKDLSMY